VLLKIQNINEVFECVDNDLEAYRYHLVKTCTYYLAART